MSGSQNLPPFRVQYHGPKGAPPVEIDKSNNEDANLQADLTVYGFWVSQPTRSVLWTLMIHDIPFRFVTVNPLKKETQRPEYLAINPLGKVPVLLDSTMKTDDGKPFILKDSGSILQYIGDKYKMEDYFPSSQPLRAKCIDYLHFHHDYTRQATTRLAFPRAISRIMKKPEEEIAVIQAKGVNELKKWMGHIEDALTSHKYLICDKPTVCDLQAYCELGQLSPLPHGSGEFPFDNYPNITRWFKSMQALPYYTESHTVMMKAFKKGAALASKL